MCGISGILGKRKKGDASKMMAQLLHRGPNQQGRYNSPDGTFVMTHARLKLVGDGPQPMENERYVISSNSEIYNYKELKSPLNYSFKHPDNDTEVLLAGLTINGPSFLKKTNGEFAFALYEKESGRVHLCRDRYGIRQLFYAIYNDALFFASDVKTLLSVIPPVISIPNLAINFKYKVSPEPVFEGIKKVPAGTILTFSLSDLSRPAVSKWYSLPRETTSMTYREALAESKYLIRDSMALRYFDTAALMLGGMDSSLLFRHNKELSAYNLLGKDTPNAAFVTRAVNKRFTLVKEEATSADIDNMIRCFEQPYYALTPQWMVVKSMSKKQKVVFSGLGPDELLGGYHYYKEPHSLEAYREQFTLFKEDLFGVEVPELFPYLPQNGFMSMSYYDITHYLAHHHLYRGDQDISFFGKEGRYPYLDHRLVELWWSLPASYKINKRILRDIYGECPKEKFGFSAMSPSQEWIRDNMSSLKSKLKLRLPGKLDDRQRIHLAMTNRFLEIFK